MSWYYYGRGNSDIMYLELWLPYSNSILAITRLSTVYSSCPVSRKWIIPSVQSLSRVQLLTPWIAARQASLSITNSRSSLILTSIESVMPSSHLILCHPLLLLPPIPPSIRVFSNDSLGCINETIICRLMEVWYLCHIQISDQHRVYLNFRGNILRET